MPAYNGNEIHISIDGVVFDADFKEVNIEPSIEEQDMTRGSGRNHRQLAGGLRATSLSIRLGYDTVRTEANIQRLKPGIHEIILGVRGAVAGRPKHQQSFLMSSSPLQFSVEKTEVAFELTMSGADEPIFDMFDGATF